MDRAALWELMLLRLMLSGVVLLGLRIGAGGLEKHEDVAGSIGSSYRLGEAAITGVGGRGRSSAMS